MLAFVLLGLLVQANVAPAQFGGNLFGNLIGSGLTAIGNIFGGGLTDNSNVIASLFSAAGASGSAAEYSDINTLLAASSDGRIQPSLTLQYCLYTRQNTRQCQALSEYDSAINSASDFQSYRETRVLMHGWKGAGDDKYIQQIKNEYLENFDYNVIVVFSSLLTRDPKYKDSVLAHRYIGARVALLLRRLSEDNGAVMSRVHMIGHSLGAHISGQTGTDVQALGLGQLGRITGLDPAGGAPFQGASADRRLDASDASYVDVIHTNGGNGEVFLALFGMKDAIGDADFYPNGGSRQPTCNILTDFPSLLPFSIPTGIDHFCSHMKSLVFFANSIAPHYNYAACRESEYSSNTGCNAAATDVALMGEYAYYYGAQGQYFLSVASSEGMNIIHPQP